MSKFSLESVLNLCIAFIASTIILISCGEDEVGKSGIDMSNTSPVIDDFIAPTEANAGEEVTLKVVSHDQEGDVLTYTTVLSCLVVGTMTFSGSMIAFAKLNGNMNKDIRLPFYNIINTIFMIGIWLDYH